MKISKAGGRVIAFAKIRGGTAAIKRLIRELRAMNEATKRIDPLGTPAQRTWSEAQIASETAKYEHGTRGLKDLLRDPVLRSATEKNQLKNLVIGAMKHRRNLEHFRGRQRVANALAEGDRANAAANSLVAAFQRMQQLRPGGPPPSVWAGLAERLD